MIPRRLPFDRELLQMNNLVSVHDLLDEVTGLRIVHRPDLFDALIICIFELLEALLELYELVSEELIVPSVASVHILGLSLLHSEISILIAEYLGVSTQFCIEALLLLVEHHLALA